MPVLARPPQRWGRLRYRYSYFARLRQLYGGIRCRPVVPYSRSLSALVSCTGLKELDPILQSIFRKNEHDAIEVLAHDPSPFGLLPKDMFKLIAV
jgi:hypothetical protein